MAGVKNFVRRVLNGMGWDFRRVRFANLEDTAIKDLLRLTNSTVVLDVGANTGQFGVRLLDTGFRGRLISFEAIPAVHAQLVLEAKKRRSWVIAPCAAVGSREGEVVINVAGNSVSSSILAMNKVHVAAAPESRVVSTEVVPMARLDQLASTYLSGTDRLYLKIDTQGYEMEVLRGATNILDRTMALQLELSLVSLYGQAPSITEMLGFVHSLGYGIFGFVPGFRDESTGRLLQIDGFFVRSDIVE